MDDLTIKAIVTEIEPVLVDRAIGKIFELTPASVAIDFRGADARLLFISVSPADSRIHLIERRVRDLEKQSRTASPFGLAARKELRSTRLSSLSKDDSERIVRLVFEGHDEAGVPLARTLVAQLTGKSSNLLLLDKGDRILATLRAPHGDGQQSGETYKPPPVRSTISNRSAPLDRGEFATLSEAADSHFSELEAERQFDLRATQARSGLTKEITRREKLRIHLAEDLRAHGDAEEHKRVGDLLLANLSNAVRQGSTVKLVDYYAPDAPEIEIEVDENLTLQDEAARRFGLYSKARRAKQEVERRLKTLEDELSQLAIRNAELERIIQERDESSLETFAGAKTPEPGSKGSKQRVERIPGVRRYRSSDGYEILVGRAARDNDHLTFRVAKPYDLWLHAADYPGSHVIVRNPTRQDVPHRTVIEAAQLAAAASQARRDSKVNVHYTQRKFLAKPKGAAPGLVRMSTFRTITVAPRTEVQRI